MEGPVVSRVGTSCGYWELALRAVDSTLIRAFANNANV